jgi:hypothetical protein
MKIFEAELRDGLEEVLSSRAYISYASEVHPSNSEFCVKQTDIKALAGLEDKDLYYTQSILVTTSWNKNDDIFDKDEVWAARNTPIHKPTNLEHNEGLIVGHITSNWPITEDGILIDESTPIENLPNKYHILTGSVIYTGYTEPELKERSSKLIAEIQNDTKYVSMECFFKGFDYGLINKTTGQYQILNRGEDTAFLTKHLRAYGGVGEYQEHKIGRVLRDITFSGKGFVDKPANPESIIFTKNSFVFNKDRDTTTLISEKKDNFQNVGVFSNQANLKENDMSLEKEVSEIKEKIEAMADCSQAITQSKSLASELESKNFELSKKLEATEQELLEIKSSVVEKEQAAKKMAEDMKKKEEEMMKMKAEFDSANETLAAYKDKEVEMMKKEKKMKRMATLIESGIESEIASSTLDKFESLDDEAFEAITTLVSAKMPPFLLKKIEEDKNKKKMEEEAVMKKKASEKNSADTDILENVETEPTIDLSVGGETAVSEVENTRAALVDFVYNRLGKKLNKGD